MAKAIIAAEIEVLPTQVQVVDRLAESNGTANAQAVPKDQVTLLQYDDAFGRLIGQSPTYSLLFTTAGDPFFHEACIFLPAWDQLYITSNLIFLPTSTNFPSTLVSSIELQRTSEDNVVHTATWHTLQPIPGIDLPNGGVNYKDGVLFCAQGSAQPGTGGIYYMSRTATPKAIVTNFHGRDFNSPNDAVVAQDGCIWFTDPCYGHDQGFRLRPKLPNQVYRFNPKTGDLRVVADGIGRPNGICFSPDEKVCYITDTDYIHGDGSRDHSRPATIYAFDIIHCSGAPFLGNRRVFAFAAEGFPDGIKCDVHGNVYSGCGDGVEVWNPAGTLIGRIMVPGGVANFCFGREGEMFVCAEQRLWRVQLARTTKGALLGV